MHVLGTLDVVFAVFQCRRIKNPIIHIAATVMAVLICASTVMIKQHSILDVMAAVALSGVIYLVVYVIFGKKRYPDLSGAKVVCFIESIASFGNKKTKSRPKREKRVPILPYEGV
jgi:F0F1-type ATP synthase membrane subunit a